MSENVLADRNPQRVVWKYPLPDNENDLQIPHGGKVLHFADQYGQFCLWVLVDPVGPSEPRHFKIVGTGNPEFYDDRVEHVGTAIVDGGRFVFHCFEVLA